MRDGAPAASSPDSVVRLLQGGDFPSIPSLESESCETWRYSRAPPCSHRMTSFDKFSVIAPDSLLIELLQSTGVCYLNPVINIHPHSCLYSLCWVCAGHGHLWDVSLVLNSWTLTIAALLTLKSQLSLGLAVREKWRALHLPHAGERISICIING